MRQSESGLRELLKGIMPDETLKSLDSQKRARERRDFLKENSLSTYICLESGKPVGFVDFEICRDKDCDKNVGEIWAIYISPEYIGKRIGKELFSISTNKLAQKGCSEIAVWVLSENKLAKEFYERQNLTADGKEREYLGLREIRYRKNIAPTQSSLHIS